MPAFKGAKYQDRQSDAESARKALLQKFLERPAKDDPLVLARKEQRSAVIEARRIREEKREKQRQIDAAEKAARDAADALAREEAERLELERIEREKLEEAALKVEMENQKKAERDARYAARKTRKNERKNALERMW